MGSEEYVQVNDCELGALFYHSVDAYQKGQQ